MTMRRRGVEAVEKYRLSGRIEFSCLVRLRLGNAVAHKRPRALGDGWLLLPHHNSAPASHSRRFFCAHTIVEHGVAVVVQSHRRTSFSVASSVFQPVPPSQRIDREGGPTVWINIRRRVLTRELHAWVDVECKCA